MSYIEKNSICQASQNNKKNNSNFFLCICISLIIVSGFVFFTANPNRSFSLKEYENLSFYQYESFSKADINENFFRLLPAEKELLNTGDAKIILNYIDVSEQRHAVTFLAHINTYTSEGYSIKLDSAYINGIKNDKNSEFIYTIDSITPFFYTFDIKGFDTVNTVDLVFSIYYQGADIPITTKNICIYKSENYKK